MPVFTCLKELHLQPGYNRGQLTAQSLCRVPETVQHPKPFWSFSKDINKDPVCYSQKHFLKFSSLLLNSQYLRDPAVFPRLIQTSDP